MNEQTYDLEVQTQISPKKSLNPHLIAIGLGAAGGGIVGSALGRSIGGKVGGAIGGVAGAIAGGFAGNQLAGYTQEFIEELQPTSSLALGADNKPIELPRHYSREELQALSKPQGGGMLASTTT
ncbi:hypothetical protein ACQFX9_17090 [Aliinostoc sp. HNIBRCY26]|uniref:hypothetical protein n=1 Tax=Aliinostoc sp. HNIBRCY26 TaxID=3418997 RepID=UPI003D020D4B